MASEQKGKDGYVFARSYAATSRLNYQYYLWQKALEFHIHPSIKDLPSDARIADVATGSGIWLMDLAPKVPLTTRLEGLDIDLAQCPPQGWLPPNLTFRQWDFFSEPPPELVAAYDVVHVRLVAVTVKDNDPSVLIRNLARLLKPGGYLQLEELDSTTAHVAAISPDVETDAVERLKELLSNPMYGRNGRVLLGPRDWISRLPATLEGKGFLGATTYRYDEPLHFARYFTDAMVASADEFADVMLRTGEAELENGLRDLVRRAPGQSAAGAALRISKMVVVARRRRD